MHWERRDLRVRNWGDIRNWGEWASVPIGVLFIKTIECLMRADVSNRTCTFLCLRSSSWDSASSLNKVQRGDRVESLRKNTAVENRASSVQRPIQEDTKVTFGTSTTTFRQYGSFFQTLGALSVPCACRGAKSERKTEKGSECLWPYFARLASSWKWGEWNWSERSRARERCSFEQAGVTEDCDT